MPRQCSICAHRRRGEIDKALAAGETFRAIVERFPGAALGPLARHKDNHLPAHLMQAEENRAAAAAVDVMAELTDCIQRVKRLSDACDEYLQDPDDPTRYYLGPRAEEMRVVYTELVAGVAVKKKDTLADLLERVEGKPGLIVQRVESRHADPRELLLKSYDRLQSRLELVAKLLGTLDETPQINVILEAFVGIVVKHVHDLEARRAIAAELAAEYGQ